MDSLYNTGCAPRNVFLVWSTVALVSAVVALVRVRMGKERYGLEPNVTVAELLVALVASIVLVVILSYVLKGLCKSNAGWWIGLAVVAVLVVATSYGCAELYTKNVTVREVNLFRRVREQLPGLKARLSRRPSPAPAPVPAPMPVRMPVAAPVESVGTFELPSSATSPELGYF